MATHNVTKGVRKLSKPQDVSIHFGKNGRPCLAVTYHNGEHAAFLISKRVAEVLIANGIAYQG